MGKLFWDPKWPESTSHFEGVKMHQHFFWKIFWAPFFGDAGSSFGFQTVAIPQRCVNVSGPPSVMSKSWPDCLGTIDVACKSVTWGSLDVGNFLGFSAGTDIFTGYAHICILVLRRPTKTTPQNIQSVNMWEVWLIFRTPGQLSSIRRVTEITEKKRERERDYAPLTTSLSWTLLGTVGVFIGWSSGSKRQLRGDVSSVLKKLLILVLPSPAIMQAYCLCYISFQFQWHNLIGFEHVRMEGLSHSWSYYEDRWFQ